jgi:hypothetical protein
MNSIKRIQLEDKNTSRDPYRVHITKEIFIQGAAVKCAYCNQTKSDKADLESIWETGMCLGCEHSYGEALDDRLTDMREDIGIHYAENN